MDLVLAGHVKVGGERVKPAREVGAGDTLEIRLGPSRRTVVVTGVAERRGPAKVAATLYEETPESREERERLALERRLARPLGADLGRVRRSRSGAGSTRCGAGSVGDEMGRVSARRQRRRAQQGADGGVADPARGRRLRQRADVHHKRQRPPRRPRRPDGTRVGARAPRGGCLRRDDDGDAAETERSRRNRGCAPVRLEDLRNARRLPWKTPAKSAAARLEEVAGAKRVVLAGAEIYLRLPRGVHGSRLSATQVESLLGVPATLPELADGRRARRARCRGVGSRRYPSAVIDGTGTGQFWSRASTRTGSRR